MKEEIAVYPISKNLGFAAFVAAASFGFAVSAFAGAPSCHAPGPSELSSRIRDAQAKLGVVKNAALMGAMAETLVSLPTLNVGDPSRPNVHVVDNSAEVNAATAAHHAREQVYSGFLGRAQKVDLIAAYRRGRATRALRDMHQMVAQLDEGLPRQQGLTAEVQNASQGAHAKILEYFAAERIAQAETHCYNQWAHYRRQQETQRLAAASVTSGIYCTNASVPPVSLGAATPAVMLYTPAEAAPADVAPSSGNGCADAGVAVADGAVNPTANVDAGAPSYSMDASAGDATLR